MNWPMFAGHVRRIDRCACSFSKEGWRRCWVSWCSGPRRAASAAGAGAAVCAVPLACVRAALGGERRARDVGRERRSVRHLCGGGACE